MTIILPEKVKTIIEELNKAGYEAYAVGGCVRDSILGRIPNDWDITTNAKPSEVKNIFKRTVDTGLKHGTVTVLIGKEGFEVTTYRIDGEYEDSRHPKEVLFTSNLKEDLLRRDFTINAMAYNETDGLVDIFGGMDDIETKTIRCVGNPTERFSEDALRLLRAIRFAAQLGYNIEKETYEAIKELAPTLKNISAERIQAELNKILVFDNPGMLKTAYETGLTAQFIPELDLCFETKQNNPHHCYTVGDHIIKSVELIEPDKTLRIVMLLHDIAKPLCKKTDEEGIDHFHGHQIKSSEMAVEILRRLKYDNDTIDKTKRLVKFHDERIESGTKYMRRAINRIGEDAFPDIFKIWRADLSAQSEYMREEKFARLSENIADYEEVIKEGDCVSLKSLAVTGRDLIDAGVEPGPKLGEILNNMLTDVLEEPGHNTREYLLSNIFKMMLIFLAFTFLFACKPVTPAVNNPASDPVEDTPSIFIYSDTCVVTSVGKSDQSITFQNLETGLRYTLTYNNLTYFSDRYGNSLTGNQVTSGQIVDISFYREDKILKSLEISPDYFAYTNVEGFKFYNSATRMEYLGDKYELNDNIVVCSGKENISVLEISDTDILTIHGNDHEIFSINVDKGHGYLSLENDKYFIDGFIEIGKDIRKITEDMVLTVPEGKYSVQISKDGTSAVKEVTVGRNQEATIDLSDVEIKKNYGNVSFVTDPEDALIYMDGEKISDTSKPVRMEYGIHEIIVRADGYESLSRFISVGSAEAEVTLKLTKLSDSSDSNNENSNTSDNMNTNDNNNNTTNTQSGNNTYVENNGNNDNANTAGTKVYIDAPSGAELYLDGNYIGVVPTSFAKKVGTIVITLKKDGYQTRSYTINLEDVASDSRYSFSELLKLE